MPIYCTRDHLGFGNKTQPEDTPWQAFNAEKYDRLYREAHYVHAFLLRCEGLSFREVGLHFGVTGSQAMGLVYKGARRMQRAMRRTTFHFLPTDAQSATPSSP